MNLNVRDFEIDKESRVFKYRETVRQFTTEKDVKYNSNAEVVHTQSKNQAAMQCPCTETITEIIAQREEIGVNLPRYAGLQSIPFFTSCLLALPLVVYSIPRKVIFVLYSITH
jgi:hypothetical protein